MAGKNNTDEVKTSEVQFDPWELVDVRLPLTSEKQDDVFVALVGYGNMKIQRGKNVQVPRWAYEILQNQEEMDQIALQRRMNLPNKT